MEYDGILWNMMEYYGILWNIMEYDGILWNIMEYYGIREAREVRVKGTPPAHPPRIRTLSLPQRRHRLRCSTT
jgi:hypothetical protein